MATGSLCAVELQFELLSSVDFFQREGKMKFVDGIFTTNSEFVAQWTLDSSLQGYRIQYLDIGWDKPGKVLRRVFHL
ncbi:uncharacterized protein J5F26_011052 isoform 2-T2 [Ciconia maguari]